MQQCFTEPQDDPVSQYLKKVHHPFCSCT